MCQSRAPFSFITYPSPIRPADALLDCALCGGLGSGLAAALRLDLGGNLEPTLEDSSVKVGFLGLGLLAARGLVSAAFGWNSSREQRLRDLEASREEERQQLVALQNQLASERANWDTERLALRTQVLELGAKVERLQAQIKAAKPKPRARAKPKAKVDLNESKILKGAE